VAVGVLGPCESVFLIIKSIDHKLKSLEVIQENQEETVRIQRDHRDISLFLTNKSFNIMNKYLGGGGDRAKGTKGIG